MSWSMFADQVCEDAESSVGFAGIGMTEVQPHRPEAGFVRIELFARHERDSSCDCLVEHGPGVDLVVQSKPVEQAAAWRAPPREFTEVLTQDLFERVAAGAVEGGEFIQARGPAACGYRIVHDEL